MITLHRFCIALLAVVPLFVRADFFAFRKLTHATTGNIVYLLYDLHITAMKNDDATDKALGLLLQKYHEGQEKCRNIDGSKDLVENKYKSKQSIKDTYQPDIIKLHQDYLSTFPNLAEQHEKLSNIVKEFEISIITEDWPTIESASREVIDTYKPSVQERALTGNLGVFQGVAFCSGITPLIGLGRSICNKFTIKELVKIPGKENAYFYNADHRGMSSYIPSKDESDMVTQNSLDTLKIMLSDPNQKKVIIAQGATHCMDICADLIKQGYSAESLVISNHLETGVKNNKDVANFLQAVKENNTKKADEYGDNADVKIAVIADPLNIAKVFEKEFGYSLANLHTIEQALNGTIAQRLWVPIACYTVSFLCSWMLHEKSRVNAIKRELSIGIALFGGACTGYTLSALNRPQRPYSLLTHLLSGGIALSALYFGNKKLLMRT